MTNTSLHLHMQTSPTDRPTRWHGLEVFGLDLHFASAARGGGYAGAAWRGLLGHALSRAVCTHPAPVCAACPSAGACAYPALFKPTDAAALPPFWLHGWQRGRGRWRLGIRWLGPQHYAVGEWLNALGDEDPERRFDGAPVLLERATHANGDAVAWRAGSGLSAPAPLPLLRSETPPAACRISFLTPLVSRHGGDPLHGALHTRLQRLVRQHGDGSDLERPERPWECRVLGQKVRRIPLARRMLAGTEWELELTHIDPAAWQLLNVGSELHAGGQTGLGCGHFLIL